MSRKKVLLIFGGVSVEHEVSRCSASSVIKEINSKKYKLQVLEITKQNQYLLYDFTDEINVMAKEIINVNNTLPKKNIDLSIDLLSSYDVIFPIIHGVGGEDGSLQGLFEVSNIPYVGADVLSSAIGMDKSICKVLFENAKIPQAKYLVFTCDDQPNEMITNIENTFTYPLFVKPASSGSSVGVTKAYNREQLLNGIKLCQMVSRKLLIEEYIKGRELECAVIGSYEKTLVSSIGEVLLKSDFYSYEAKYIAEEETTVATNLSKEVINLIKEYATAAFKAIDCYGLARVDFFLTEENKPILNEINTMPGFTNISMYPTLMMDTGLKYSELIDQLITLAFEKSEHYQFITNFEEVS